MRYSGEIGFEIPVNKGHGVHGFKKVVKPCFGDVVRADMSIEKNDVNSDISLNNAISILADPFISTNFMYARYITFMNEKWSISTVDLNKYPRIIINIRGLYMEEESEEDEE